MNTATQQAEQRLLNQELSTASESGDLAEISRLLAFGADPRFDDSAALSLAASQGHADCVKLLIPVSDPNVDGSRPLRWAAHGGHAECVKLLIPVCNPSGNEFDTPLCMAADQGHVECVKLLMTCSDPKLNDSIALCAAAHRGQVECVKLLIPSSDPTAKESQPLSLSAAAGNVECVELLIPVSDPKAKHSWALQRAALNGHVECVKRLIPFSDSTAIISALRLAARSGRTESFRLLLAVASPSFLNDNLFPIVLAEGHSEIVALMLAREPSLFEEFDLPAHLSTVQARGHVDLAAMILSLIEKNELSSAAEQELTAQASPSTRL